LIAESRAFYAKTKAAVKLITRTAQKKARLTGSRAKSTPKEEGGGDKLQTFGTAKHQVERIMGAPRQKRKHYLCGAL
jgi:hypothetical protein